MLASNKLILIINEGKSRLLSGIREIVPLAVSTIDPYVVEVHSRDSGLNIVGSDGLTVNKKWPFWQLGWYRGNLRPLTLGEQEVFYFAFIIILIPMKGVYI